MYFFGSPSHSCHLHLTELKQSGYAYSVTIAIAVTHHRQNTFSLTFSTFPDFSRFSRLVAALQIIVGNSRNKHCTKPHCFELRWPSAAHVESWRQKRAQAAVRDPHHQTSPRTGTEMLWSRKRLKKCNVHQHFSISNFFLSINICLLRKWVVS